MEEKQQEFLNQLNKLPVGSEIMDGVKKISKGSYRIEAGEMIMITGSGGVWDLFQALKEEARKWTE